MSFSGHKEYGTLTASRPLDGSNLSFYITQIDAKIYFCLKIFTMTPVCDIVIFI